MECQEKLHEKEAVEESLTKTLIQKIQDFEDSSKCVKDIQQEVDSVLQLTNAELNEKQAQIDMLMSQLSDTQKELDLSSSCLKDMQAEVDKVKTAMENSRSGRDTELVEKQRQVDLLLSQLSEKQRLLEQSVSNKDRDDSGSKLDVDRSKVQSFDCSCVSKLPEVTLFSYIVTVYEKYIKRFFVMHQLISM